MQSSTRIRRQSLIRSQKGETTIYFCAAFALVIAVIIVNYVLTHWVFSKRTAHIRQMERIQAEIDAQTPSDAQRGQPGYQIHY